MTPLAKILLGAFFLGIMAWLWIALEARHVKETRRRIQRIRKRRSEDPVGKDLSLRRKKNELQGLLNWLTRPLPDFKNLGDLLERAGYEMTPKQYVLRRVLVALILIGVIHVLLKKSLVLALAVGLVIGVWLPLKWLKMKIAKYQKAFVGVFPDAIDLIVRGLRSGLPVSESLVMVSQEVQPPVGEVFGQVAGTMKLGVPLEKALQETAKKLDISEFNFFTTSIMLQRETGGNLAEILNNLSEVLRARSIMRLKIKALSSEARASTMIIGALPFFVMGVVAVMSPTYIEPLFSTSSGNTALGIAAGMLGFGLYTMRRMAQFEI